MNLLLLSLFMAIFSSSPCHSLLKQAILLAARHSVTQNVRGRFAFARFSATMPSLSSTALQDPPMVVVIAGPTASGKSDVAAQLCRQYRSGMIISADSVQAYRGVQIGANKPTEKERAETPHVLIDVVNHEENYNAAEWREDALYCVQTLLLQQPEPVDDTANSSSNEESNENETSSRRQQRRRGIQSYIQQSRNRFHNGDGGSQDVPVLPVVCGGTMMYVQWLVHGRPDACQPTTTAIAASHDIIQRYQQDNNYQGAVDHVSSFGEVFANRTKQFCGEDWYRLRRTLEIAVTAQEQAAVGSNSTSNDDGDNSHRQERMDALVENLYSGQRQGSLKSLGYDVRCFFLCPDDRMSHTAVVDERCEQMIVNGLIKETTDLKLSGCLPEMAERAIGYRQTLEYLCKRCGSEETETEEGLFENFLNDFTTVTRRYAKKQMSWFRKDEEFLFVPVPLEVSKDERVDAVSKDIEAYCQLSREDYDKILGNDDSKSAQCKKENELQGKSMKFYQFQRHILKPGSQKYLDAFAEAVECRERIRNSRIMKRSIEDAF